MGTTRADALTALPSGTDNKAEDQDNDPIILTLKIACLLLDLEARAHEENEQWLPERRKRIAATLRSFTAQVRLKLEDE